MMRSVGFVTVAFLVGLVGCDGGDDTFRIGERRELQDDAPPRIEHDNDRSPRTQGQPVTIQAVVTDRSEIDDIVLYFQREPDGQEWQSVSMSFDVTPPVEDDPNRPNYVADATAEIPGSFVTSASVRYYIWAVDGSQNANEAVLPSGAPANFFSFPVVPPRQ